MNYSNSIRSGAIHNARKGGLNFVTLTILHAKEARTTLRVAYVRPCQRILIRRITA